MYKIDSGSQSDKQLL